VGIEPQTSNLKHTGLEMATLSLISGVVIAKILATVTKAVIAFTTNKSKLDQESIEIISFIQYCVGLQ
jgi:hypothetical protein